MKKRVFYTELAYILGVFTLAVGTAMMEKGGLGLSMVVAPAYILHLKISQYLPFFSFGMAEYTFQAVLILIMILLLRKAKATYLFSFVTTVIYGFMLDGVIVLLSFLPISDILSRIAIYTAGMVVCSLGVALMFRTYIPQAAYEMFVKETSAHFTVPIHKIKLAYDYISCGVAIMLSFLFFGFWQFYGIGWGTVACTLVNGSFITMWTKLLEKYWDFSDGLFLRKYF